WYFLGLQEMLVYFDPWLAGVVLPSLIIVGLIAIPYIDKNPKGNGYFTFAERKAEVTIFLFGFAVLWSSLIVLGTFLRGPNWNFFGPFEYWDIHKLAALTNVNLSEYIYVRGLHTALPVNPLVREMFGILIFLFLSVIWMVWDDFDREWKSTQRRFAQLEYQVTQAQRAQAAQSVDKNKLAQLDAQRKAAEAQIAANKAKVDELNAKLADADKI